MATPLVSIAIRSLLGIGSESLSGTVEFPKKEDTPKIQEEEAMPTSSLREDFNSLLGKYYDAIDDSYNYNGDELQYKKFQSSIDLAYAKLTAFAGKHDQFKKEVPNKYLVKLSSEASFEDLTAIVPIPDPGFKKLDEILGEAWQKYGGDAFEDSNSNNGNSSGNKEDDCRVQ